MKKIYKLFMKKIYYIFLTNKLQKKHNLFEVKASKEKLLPSQEKLIFITFFINEMLNYPMDLFLD